MSRPVVSVPARSGCLLCGKPTMNVALWCPTARYSRLLGAPTGTLRRIVYRVCGGCARRPRWTSAVEDKLLARAREELAKPESN
jgi:hypothetical protein